jgi:hypothetical protein
MNNWHNSLRKVKNCDKGKSGRKDLLDRWLAEKSVYFFGKGYCKKCTGKSSEVKGKQEGLIAKLKCQ